MTYTVNIPGKPVGKGRPRYANIKGVVRTYTPKTTADYEKLVKANFRKQNPRATPLSGPINFEILALYPIPASYSKRKSAACQTGCLTPTVKPDIDNVAKSILDALNQIAYADDAQIVNLMVKKRYTSGEACVRVSISEMEANANA